MAADTTKFLLSEDAIPTHWVNLLPDLPGEPLPPLNAQTMAPAGTDDIFDTDAEELWRRVLSRKGGHFAVVATMPIDPSVN